MLESIRNKIMNKLESVESGTSVDTAKKEILGYVEVMFGLATGKKVSFAKTPEEEEKNPLQKKYDEIISKKGGED